MNKKTIIIGITCAGLFIAGISYCITMSGCSRETALSTSLQEDGNVTVSANLDAPGPVEATAQAVVTQEPVAEQTKIYVHICGAVVHPGVYATVSGSRVCEMIELAGGLKEDAAGDYINQAEPVADGQRIYIPTKEEIEGLAASQVMEGSAKASDQAKEDSGLVNINTADAQELMTLPGIGQAKADSIIKYRTENGNFSRVDELMNISGIKEGVYDKISSYITVE